MILILAEAALETSHADEHAALEPLTWLAIAGWYALCLLGMAGSSLCSGLETGAYTLNRVRLHVLAQKPGPAQLLQRLLERPNRVLVTLLIGTNVSTYIATYSFAVPLEASGISHNQMILIEMLLVTPTLFVVGEVMPKDLFQGYADKLMYTFARGLYVFERLLSLTGLVGLIDWISGALAKRLGSPEDAGLMLHPRRVMTSLIKEGVGEGLISPYQSNMVDRVLGLGRLTVSEVMIPWSAARVARTKDEPGALWEIADRSPYARLPLVNRKGKPIGVLNLFDVLTHEPGRCPPLERLAGDLTTLAPDTPCRAALRKMQTERVSMAIIADDPRRPLGLVTVKDLVEPLVGELESW
ncbi:MAG: CNNM domain-containing protein [Planctomycetota bacterium]